MGFTGVTKVEHLQASKPGLRQLVDLMLDAHRTHAEIVEAVEKEFGEKLITSAISSYKVRRWKAQRDRVEKIKDHSRAIMELMEGGRAVSDIQQALLFEQVQTAMADGRKLDPEFAMREQRLWSQQQLKREQLEQDKQALELKIRALELKREHERKQVEVALGESRDPRQAVDEIRGIYGLAPTSGGAAALPGPVGQ